MFKHSRRTPARNEIVREQMAGKEFSGGGAYKVRSVVMDKADE